MLKRLTIILLSLTLLTACKEQSDLANDTLKMLSEVGELSTQELTFTRIAALKGPKWKEIAGARNIAVTMTAYVEVGVDLKEDYEVFYDKKSSSVKLVLPPVKRLHCNIPIDEINPEYSRVGFFRSEFTPEDRKKLYDGAESQMLLDIDKELRDHSDTYESVARCFFDVMLSTLGYQNIVVEFKHVNDESNGAK